VYECLASTFTQDYPKSKLTISFCISSQHDPALPVLQQLLQENPSFDARIYIEEEDPNLRREDGKENNLGPNPKIRNMSRAYREAKGDIIWIADCNVWLSKSVAGLMVDLLCGFPHGQTSLSTLTATSSSPVKYKFVHQLPLAVDVSQFSSYNNSNGSSNNSRTFLSHAGGMLEELFMSTSHAKFYTAISTVAIAPCTVGKSNMFRRSHLDALTQPNPTQHGRSPGIDFFSDNICEDHLIGDLLWKTAVPNSVRAAADKEGKIAHNVGESGKSTKWGNHALLRAPPCIQPQTDIPVSVYAARRTRWLRVRKFTVPAATLVEPGTESFVASALGAWGLTSLQWCTDRLRIPATWSAFWTIWIVSVIAWACLDRAVWMGLQGWSGEVKSNLKSTTTTPAVYDEQGRNDEESLPIFVGSARGRSLAEWLRAWLGRELLAWPVWAWAVLGGTQVVWRGKKFWVGVDMKVREIDDTPTTPTINTNAASAAVAVDRRSKKSN
jgi:ceramide glucosyltransferase